MGNELAVPHFFSFLMSNSYPNGDIKLVQIEGKESNQDDEYWITWFFEHLGLIW